MTDPKTEYSLPLVMAYFKTHKKWPKEKQIKVKMEAILSQYPVQKQIAWFQDHPPISTQGCILYIHALKNISRQKAQAKAKEYWQSITLTSQERDAFLKIAGNMLSENDHLLRINQLFFEGKYNEIACLIPLLKNTKNRKNTELRLSVAQNTVTCMQKPDMHLDDGMRYQWIRFCRIQRKDDDAYQWLTQPIKEKPQYAQHFWLERNMMARRFMEYAYEDPKNQKAYFKKALDMIRYHGLSAGEKYADACFLSGFLEYQLKNHTSAFKIFTHLHEKVRSPISKSRAAYWAGLSAIKAKNGQHKTWFEKSAQHTMTFYGQTACLRLKKKINLLPGLPPYSSKFPENSLACVLKLFDQSTPRGVIQDFCFAAIHHCHDINEAKKICAYAKKHFPADIFIKTCKEAGFKFGRNPMGHKDMPTLKLPKGVGCTPLDWATVHAIIYRESQFSLCEKSHAGALGLMQVIPQTAYAMAKKLKISLKNEWDILNQEKNIRLGSLNIKYVLDVRKNSYILALCDYNTAMTNVNIWLKQMGDPRCKDVDVIEWIEKIPFFETRAYVIRVLENVVNYLLINGRYDLVTKLFKKERIIS